MRPRSSVTSEYDVKDDARFDRNRGARRDLHTVHYLAQLESLARTQGARLTVTVHPSQTPPVSATWKVPGKHAETIESLTYTPVDEILAALLVRLGVLHQLPTNENVINRMTPRQIARVRELIAEVNEIKRDAMTGPASAEPSLASPRSSLHPQKWAHVDHEVDR